MTTVGGKRIITMGGGSITTVKIHTGGVRGVWESRTRIGVEDGRRAVVKPPCWTQAPWLPGIHGWGGWLHVLWVGVSMFLGCSTKNCC